jgi:outer membrane protein assembly factor BamB
MDNTRRLDVRLAVFAACLVVAPMDSTAFGADGVDWAAAGRRIVAQSGLQGGLIAHVGSGQGELTAALRVNDRFVVHGLDRDAPNVATAREYLRSVGLCGPVSVEQWNGDTLPYADNLVNLAVVTNGNGQVDADEIKRVLAPGGIAVTLDAQRSTLESYRKPWPDDIDPWTHYLHDASGNAVADDSVVGPPRRLQWTAKPLYCRGHEWDSSVSAFVSGGGRVFYIVDEGLTGIMDLRFPPRWCLVARDAFSGVLLWKRPLPQWGWREWKQASIEKLGESYWRGGQRLQTPIVLPRRLVVAGDRLYVTLGFRAPLSVLDAASGREITTFKTTEGVDEVLCVDDTLILCVREIPATGAARGLGQAPTESVLAVKADTGEVLWKKQEQRILPLSLAAAGRRVFFHTYDELVSLDLGDGSELWRTNGAGEATRGSGKRQSRWGTWSTPTTVVARDKAVVLLSSDGLRAFSADDGNELWSAPAPSGCGAAQPPDLFVVNGLVWAGGPGVNTNTRDHRNALIHGLEETEISKEGRDLLSGEVKKTITVRNLIDFGHHFRCYRSKATRRYLLWPKRGVEFLDLQEKEFDRCDWLRGPCRFGVMPANGLLYVPPHQCFCYPGVLLNGFNALAPDGGVEGEDGGVTAEYRLVRGPASESPVVQTSHFDPQTSSDWPTYRHDAKRSGSTSSKVDADVREVWTARVGERLSPPVVAQGKVLVAAMDSHTVHCVDAAGGHALWTYTVGARVDSPQTVYDGLVLFGSDDGWVYCLRAADGQLAWRFRAAPSNRHIVRYGQVSSAWPVHGSVLVEDGVAYVSAGCSSFLDGGIYVYGLDPRTGKLLHQAHLDGPHPKIPDQPGWAWDMEGARSEVLVSQGGYVYLRQVKFDKRLQVQETSRNTRMGDRDAGLHLFSTSSLLDDSWFNRAFWMYADTWPGYYRTNRGASKTGQLLVFDDQTTYGVRVYERADVPLPWFIPGQGYRLFADDNDNEPVLAPKAANWDKGPGFTRSKPAKWTVAVPVRARALVLAGDTLFFAGPPDVLPTEDPLAAFEGRKGGKLWVISPGSGAKLAEYDLDDTPVLDGLIAANGKLYLSTEQGSLMCFGASETTDKETN